VYWSLVYYHFIFRSKLKCPNNGGSLQSFLDSISIRSLNASDLNITTIMFLWDACILAFNDSIRSQTVFLYEITKKRKKQNKQIKEKIAYIQHACMQVLFFMCTTFFNDIRSICNLVGRLIVASVQSVYDLPHPTFRLVRGKGVTDYFSWSDL
jgi:hypothetical protein